MDPVQKLLAVEAIRKLKATYWYAMDTKNWDLVASVFTDDCIFDMRRERAHSLGGDASGLPPVEQSIAERDLAVCVGGRNIADKQIRAVVEHWITVHHGAEPIIEITGDDSATAIWPLFDYIDDGRSSLKGYGHYYEKYKKVSGKWLTSHVELRRLRTDGTHPWANQSLAGR